MFLYNQQVTDTLTQSFLGLARKYGIPVVGVYETMPTPGYDLPVVDAGRGTGAAEGGRGQDHDIKAVMVDRDTAITAEPGRATDREQALAVEGVSVRLGGREVLHDVRFSIRAGRVHGPHRVQRRRQDDPAAGDPGAPEARRRPGAHRRRGRGRRDRAVGYVPQKIELDPDMPLRARDLVGLGLDGHRFGIPLPSRARREMVDEMLRRGGRRGLRRRQGRAPCPGASSSG